AVAWAGHCIHVDRRVAAADLAPVVDLAVVDVVHLLQREVADRIGGLGDDHQAVPGHRGKGEPGVLRAAVGRTRAAGEVGRAVAHRVDAGGRVERLQFDTAVAGLGPG